jgi:hypothetical protein
VKDTGRSLDGGVDEILVRVLDPEVEGRSRVRNSIDADDSLVESAFLCNRSGGIQLAVPEGRRWLAAKERLTCSTSSTITYSKPSRPSFLYNSLR